ILFWRSELHCGYFDNRLTHIPRGGNVLEGNFKFAMISGRNRRARRAEQAPRLPLRDLIEVVIKLDRQLHAGQRTIAAIADFSGNSSAFLVQKIFSAAYLNM